MVTRPDTRTNTDVVHDPQQRHRERQKKATVSSNQREQRVFDDSPAKMAPNTDSGDEILQASWASFVDHSLAISQVKLPAPLTHFRRPH